MEIMWMLLGTILTYLTEENLPRRRFLWTSVLLSPTAVQSVEGGQEEQLVKGVESKKSARLEEKTWGTGVQKPEEECSLREK